MADSAEIGVNIIILIVIAYIFSTVVFPFIIVSIRPNMQPGLGNPKAVYLYDIDSSCNINEENNIVSALNYLSSNTGLNFIRIPAPFAYIFGGIGYSCNGVRSNIGAIGESDTGMAGISYFMVVWNNIRLSSVGKEVILHETLHSIGFGHSKDLNSIMYPIERNNSQIDLDIIDFIKTFYVKNPLAYLTIITVNMIVLPILFLLLLCGVAVTLESILKKIKK